MCNVGGDGFGKTVMGVVRVVVVVVMVVVVVFLVVVFLDILWLFCVKTCIGEKKVSLIFFQLVFSFNTNFQAWKRSNTRLHTFVGDIDSF